MSEEIIHEKIGFTKDGKVFITTVRPLEDGQRVQLILQWAPDQARDLAKKMLDAADKCDIHAGRMVIPAVGGLTQ